MKPQLGNTFAISFGSTEYHEDYLGKLRVRFYQYKNRNDTQYEAVLCSDLYSQQIEKETQEDRNNNDFLNTFGN